MNLNDAVNQALGQIDAEDADNAPEAHNNEGTDNETTKDAGTSKPTTGKDAQESAAKDTAGATDETKGSADKTAEADGKVDEDDKAANDTKAEEEEGTYTADDALEVEDTPAPTQNAPTDQSGIQLSPAEQKYVVENIGEPLVLNGYRLDKDGNQEAYQVKAYVANQLPSDFKFTSDADALQATQAFNNLEQKANNLLQEKRQEQSRTQALEFERKENEAIRSGVAQLQHDGRMPKFRVKPGEIGFDEDPAAHILDDVLKIMADRNQQYLEAYNKGAAYRHIGVEEAYDIYERTNPAKQAERVTDTKQKAEDTARKSKAERGDSNRGDAPRIMKSTVAPGTTMRDLIAIIDAEEA